MTALSARNASLLCCTLVLVFGFATVVGAQDASNLLLVVNEASSDSNRIGDYYAKARHVPPSQVVRIKTAESDEIARERFVDEIARPIAAWLAQHAAQDRILYIVLTKGIPLRVAGTDGPQGTVSSVDSELTLLYRLLAGGSAPAAGPLPNPFYLGTASVSGAKRFGHEQQDIFLVTRLDAFTVDDVFRLIDRSLSPTADGTFVLDGRGGLVDAGGDGWLRTAAANLEAAGLGARVVSDTSAKVIGGQKNVLGYSSWGSNDPAITARAPDLAFAPGALGAMFVSTDARTFLPPPPEWKIGTWNDKASYFAGSPQSLAGDLIRAGLTGVSGHVAEPYLAGSVRPQILFPAYAAGYPLAEAFYLAMPYLSWQTVVIGDPLCSPFKGQSLTAAQLNPPVDAETELPRYFSDRRLAALASVGISAQAARLSLKAETRMARGDRAGAQEALEQATALDPRLIVDQFILATRYAEGGDFDRSIERYRKILATAPSEMRSANNLAYTLAVNRKNPIEALPLAEKAYKLSKTTPPRSAADVLGNASIADTLGWVHYLLGNFDAAAEYLNEAVKGAPNNPEIHLHLAELHRASGRADEARAELKIALGLNSELAKRDDVVNLQKLLAGP